MTARGRVVTARGRIAALAVAAGVVLSACGVRGADLGTTSSACFQALPVAFDAVHHQGRLVGVRIEKPGSKGLARVPGHETLGATKVCLVAFRGDFAAAEVDHAITTARTVSHGPYAVAAVTADGRRLLATVVLDRLPIGFRHL